jgi:hypothetical protein
MVYFDPSVYARWQFLVCFGKMWIIEDMWKMIVDHQHQYSTTLGDSALTLLGLSRGVTMVAARKEWQLCLRPFGSVGC